MPTPLKNKHTRKPRVLLRVRVEFEGGLSDDPIQGEGQSTDINVSGCSVESDQRVSIGTHLALRIHLSGHAVPVTVTVARVRWVHGSEFGIEFIQIQHQDQLRHSQLPKETQEVKALSIPETPL